MPASAASPVARFHHTPSTSTGRKALAASEKAAPVAINMSCAAPTAATPASPVTRITDRRATRSCRRTDAVGCKLL